MSRNSSLPEVDNDTSRPVSVVSHPPEEQLNSISNPGYAQDPNSVDNTFKLLDDVITAATNTLNKVSELRSKANLRTDTYGIKIQKLNILSSKIISDVSKLRIDEAKVRTVPHPPRRRNSYSGTSGGSHNQQYCFQYDYDAQHGL